MKILGVNGGHDGAIAVAIDGTLDYVREAEKGSYKRHASLSIDSILYGLQKLDDIPDVIAHSGWWKGLAQSPVLSHPAFFTGNGYYGLQEPTVQRINFLGKEIKLVNTSHERSHIWCAVGLSKIDPQQPTQVLVWEGEIGRFYYVEKNQITLIGDVLNEPGSRFIFPYALANPNVSDDVNPSMILSNAGKQMALAAYSKIDLDYSTSDQELLDKILASKTVFPLLKKDLRDHPLYNIGVESDAFKRFARIITNEMFNVFWNFAQENLDRHIPLVVAGGCGLNCEWNTKFRDNWHGEYFVPPCPNDSGIAVGAVIDAQQQLTQKTRLNWQVDCGDIFKFNKMPAKPWLPQKVSLDEIAQYLNLGAIFAWVTGKFELGPRALGNRSLIASPFKVETKNKLNTIKQRENFRPIAPVCQEEFASEYFDISIPSPHMLYFQRVKSSQLEAVTHVDGTARIQTVNKRDNLNLWSLLDSFRQLTGFGVLCNTSLNFKTLGFINSMTELEVFASHHGLDGFIVENQLWIHQEFLDKAFQ